MKTDTVIERDCLLLKNLVESLPGLYQPMELASLKGKQWVRYTSMKIHPDVHEGFIKSSENAKNAVVARLLDTTLFTNMYQMKFGSTILTDEQVNTLHKNLRAFYSHIQIHSKTALVTLLKSGFDWLVERIMSLPENDPSWIMIVENLLNITENRLEHPEPSATVNGRNVNYTYKSSEWIGHLFLEHCKKLRKNGEAVLNRYACLDQEFKGVQATPASSFVLFDDGAYSGEQKAKILRNFIEKVHYSKPTSAMFIVIPYYTRYARDRFEKIMTQFAMSKYPNVPGAKVLDKQLTATFEATHRHYKIETTFTVTPPGEKIPSEPKTHTTTTNVYFWFGGVEMEDTISILNHQVLKDVTDPVQREKQFFQIIRYLGYYSTDKDPFEIYKSIGATLTLFEHKVPDFLSLNAAFGNNFRDHTEMDTHYTYNPPYKLKVDEFFDKFINTSPVSTRPSSSSKKHPIKALKTYFRLNGGTYIMVHRLAALLRLFAIDPSVQDARYMYTMRHNLQTNPEREPFETETESERHKQFTEYLYKAILPPNTVLQDVTLYATAPNQRFPYALCCVLKCHKKRIEHKQGVSPGQRTRIETENTLWLSVYIDEALTEFRFFPADQEAKAIGYHLAKVASGIPLMNAKTMPVDKKSLLKGFTELE